MKKINFPFTLQVRNLLAAKIWDSQKCQELVKTISNQYFSQNEKYDTIVNNFIEIASAVDKIRNQFIGIDKEIDRVNFFVNLIGEYATSSLIGSGAAEKMLEDLVKTYANGRQEYLSIKLRAIQTQLISSRSLLDYYKPMVETIIPTITAVQKHVDLKGSINDLFSELLELRKYGVKASAFEDNVAAKKNDYWIFLPGDYMFSEIIPEEIRNNWQIRKKRELNSKENIAIISISDKRNIVTNVQNFGEQKIYGMEATAAFSINRHGEISNGTSVSGDLRLGFERRGMSEIYDLLKANAIFRLYDLVVPTMIHKKYELPKFPEGQKKFGFFSSPIKFDPTIYLRRIRVIFDHLREVKLEAEIEMNDAFKDKPSINHREHDVVCHIRRLPEGYRPSQKARLLAKEILNYELKDGETFVCQHLRNKGGEKSELLHKAVIKR